ncbi:MAG: tRNA (adenosine(37)-N6)-threonylcarbamoyltransferase complex ATPase subunit type 1 TsaE [Oscillospiraceae bacterium]|nr:tRNA (adenosine(37)-N6)-threonylcarbamoyltransferase complex ATPase subunit type 1 TsaE [Oscillospiraceae bacterium]
MTVETHSEAETEALGERLAKCLRAGSVCALYGELGAGKTAFVRGMARGLGVEESVTSPTFTIVNEYPGDPPLFHFDMYRLKNAEELYGIGWEDYLDREGVCVTEWSENVEEALPEDAVRVRIRRLSDTDRRIAIEGML